MQFYCAVTLLYDPLNKETELWNVNKNAKSRVKTFLLGFYDSLQTIYYYKFGAYYESGLLSLLLHLFHSY